VGSCLFFIPLILFLGAVLFLWGILLGKCLGLLSSGNTLTYLSWEWNPTMGHYGVLAMMINSLLIAFFSTFIAFFWAFGAALFLQGVGPRFLCIPILFLIRVLSSVPSLVFALGGALYVVPFVRLYTDASGYSLLATILTLSFFLLPFQTKLCTAAFSAAEAKIGISAEALGFTRLQKILWIVIPESKNTLVACAAMGFCRSLGDTMIALLVSGNAPQIPESFFSPVRALTAHIALVASTNVFSPVFDSLFVAVFFLLTLTVGTTLLSSKRKVEKL
jgi:phosphate transport system permease protein